MYITWQSLITTGSVLTALTLIITLFVKLVRFIDRQKAQDNELKLLREKHDEDVSILRQEEREKIAEMNRELTLLVYGTLACLKGLQEKGCNGPVTEAIDKIEKHINQKAHGQRRN